MQDANWEAVRDISLNLAWEAGRGTGCKSTRLEDNGFVIEFHDGSEIKYVPEIKDRVFEEN